MFDDLLKCRGNCMLLQNFGSTYFFFQYQRLRVFFGFIALFEMIIFTLPPPRLHSQNRYISKSEIVERRQCLKVFRTAEFVLYYVEIEIDFVHNYDEVGIDMGTEIYNFMGKLFSKHPMKK